MHNPTPLLGLGLTLLCAACSSSSSVPDAGSDPLDGGPDAGAPVVWTGPRVTADQADDNAGAYQVHVLYVEPADRTASVPLDTNGTIRKSVSAFNDWFADRTGGAKMRLDTHQGLLDITYVKLDAGYTEAALAEGTVGTPSGPAYLRDRLENLLKGQFGDRKKLYLVYWDGLSFGHCGSSAYAPGAPGHFSTLQVGGIFESNFLTSSATAGDTTLQVFNTSSLPLPAVPFSATLGTETVHITAVASQSVTVSPAVAAAHPSGEVLHSLTNIPDCRANPFSIDGHQLNYWEFVGAHELLHPLGVVPPEAADYAVPPVAAGHVGSTNPAGTADLMYQGSSTWGCEQRPAPASPATAACQLDMAHRNYFQVTGRTVSVDLASSVFLSPSAPDAGLPPGW